MRKRNLIILAILVLLFIVLFVFRPHETVEEQIEEPAEELPTESVVPFSPLASGEQVYDIMWPEDQRFGIRQVVVDPLDVDLGQIQTVIVSVEDMDRSDITEENRVTAAVFTDNDSVTFSLRFIEITDQEQALVSVWQGSWELQDTYKTNYQLAIRAFKETTDDSITITFR